MVEDEDSKSSLTFSCFHPLLRQLFTVKLDLDLHQFTNFVRKKKNLKCSSQDDVIPRLATFQQKEANFSQSLSRNLSSTL